MVGLRQQVRPAGAPERNSVCRSFKGTLGASLGPRPLEFTGVLCGAVGLGALF